ncbi:MAG: hypothetical protein ACRDE2_13885, partial [Chitinophagaceae bacterium]
MKPILKKLLFCIAQLLITAMLYAQDVTIDYQTWNPSNPPCNLFASATNVPSTINGVSGTTQHQTLIGQPVYNSVDKSVELDCGYNNGNPQGTKYRLSYSFKKGYIYRITVSAAEVINTLGTSYSPYLRLDITNTGGGGNIACNGTQIIIQNLSGSPLPLQVTGLSFLDHEFMFSSSSAAFSTLEVSAIPAIGGSGNTIRIRKITIVETAPTPTFTLPSTVNIPCGSTNPQTFTITNEYNSPGVTGYTWNLGASNGWLYNGSPAPATIST